MKSPLAAYSALILLALSGAAAIAQQYKFETPMPPGVATPDTVETSIGSLHLSYGYPDPGTIEKVYNNLVPRHSDYDSLDVTG